MIKNLRIKNFKGLVDLPVNDVSRVNLIGGRNNVGKTSLLEALFLIHDCVNPHIFLRLHNWRNLQFVDLVPESMWAPIFTNYDMGHDIEIVVNEGETKSGRLVLHANDQYVKPTVLNQPLIAAGELPNKISTNLKAAPSLALDVGFYVNNEIKIDSHLVIESGNILIFNNLIDIKLVLPIFISATLRTNVKEDVIRFGKLDLKGEQGEIADFIKKVIEPRLISLSSITLADQSVLHAQLEGIPRKIPVSYMGDGMARLISIILAIANCENGCLFIDEIENGLHYSVMPKIWDGILKAARKYNCQIFATTHSYECLESAVKGIDAELKDEFRYIRLDRIEEKLQSFTYVYDELSASIERGWEVR